MDMQLIVIKSDGDTHVDDVLGYIIQDRIKRSGSPYPCYQELQVIRMVLTLQSS